MQNIKEKILAESKTLFFEEGIANTRLQQIADASGISVGNLAYHYKNKEAIIQAVYDNLFVELANILSQYMKFADLDGLDKLFSYLYHFLENNKFTFNNTWEIARHHLSIQNEWLAVNNKIQQQLKNKIQHCIQNNIIKPEPYQAAYELLIHNILFALNNWIAQQFLRKKEVSEILYKQHIWALIYPHFTNQGITNFNQVIVPVFTK